MNIAEILKYIVCIVVNWEELGTQLDIPQDILAEIRANNPHNVVACKRQMISRWMESEWMDSEWMDSESLTEPSCWWSLVKATKDMDENVIAHSIENDYRKYLMCRKFLIRKVTVLNLICCVYFLPRTAEAIKAQEHLLDPQKSHLKPDESFLQLFSTVVSDNWPYLSSVLSLSTRDIMEELKRRKRCSPANQALFMLQKWKLKEEATYGQLYERLRTVVLVR